MRIASSTRIVGFVGFSLALLVFALSHSLRIGWGRDAALLVRVAWPEVLSACAAGAALGLWGALRRATYDSPYAELVLLCASAGGVIGAVMALALGPWALLASTAGLSGVGAGAALGLGRRPRVFFALQALLVAAASFVLLSGTMYLRTAPEPSRRVFAWLLADLSSATWPSAVLLCAAVLGLLSLALRDLTNPNQDAPRRALLAWASFGLALGAVGPIACLSTLAVGCARALAPERSPALQAVLSALVGAAGLVFVEATQRVALGGFSWPLGPAAAILGGPLCLWQHAAQQRRAGLPPHWAGYKYVEGVITIAMGAALWFWVASLIRSIRAFLA